MDESTGFWKWLRDQVTARAWVLLMLILFVLGISMVLPPKLSELCLLTVTTILILLVVWKGFTFSGLRGSYIEDRYPEEFDRIAEIFEKSADEVIRKKYDRMASLELDLYLYDLYSRDFDGLSRECAAKSEGKAKDEMLFYLLAQKADYYASAYYASSNDFARADESLRQALALKPETFLLRLRLAEVSERLGAGAEAIAAYEQAIVLAPENPQIKEYLRKQIQRVRKYGPRKQLPVQGITYGSV